MRRQARSAFTASGRAGVSRPGGHVSASIISGNLWSVARRSIRVGEDALRGGRDAPPCGADCTAASPAHWLFPCRPLTHETPSRGVVTVAVESARVAILPDLEKRTRMAQCSAP